MSLLQCRILCDSVMTHATWSLFYNSSMLTLHNSLRAGLHHGPWSQTMEDGIFSWSNFHGPISKKTIYKAFGPLTRCKPNVDQKWMIMHQKMNVLVFFNSCLTKAIVDFFKSKFNHSLVYSCLHLLFPKKFIEKYYNNISLPWILVFFY